MVLVLLLLVGCSECGSGKFNKKVDLTGIEVDLELKRFERDFAAIDPDQVQEGLKELENRYPDFLPFYVEQLMRFGKLDDPDMAYVPLIHQFLENRYVQGLHDTCQFIFPIMEKEIQSR